MTDRIYPEIYGRATSLRIPYDVYGHGPKRIVFLSGMSLSRRLWVHQISHFAKKPDDYTCLVVENRGNGEVKNRPLQAYGTTVLAKDVWAVLDLLRWTAEKEIHLVGLSMGGMIALKLSLLIPDRVASLCLTSTCSQWRPSKAATTTVEPVKRQLGIAVASKPQQTAESMIRLCFPPDHLDATHPDHPEHKSNFDRYMAWSNLLISSNQPKIDMMGQLVSVLTHKVSRGQLQSIGKSVQFCQVVVGDKDDLIHPSRSKVMSDEIGCKLRTYPDGGHIIPWQHPTEFNADLEAMVEQAHTYWQEQLAKRRAAKSQS